MVVLDSDHMSLLQRGGLLDFDGRAVAEYQRLHAARLRLGTMDLKIAAVTLASGATLLTRNSTDFSRVPGLHFEDWSA